MTSKQTENLKTEGKSITYSYDPQRRRLQNLVVNAKVGTIMDNAYSYECREQRTFCCQQGGISSKGHIYHPGWEYLWLQTDHFKNNW